MVDRLNAHNGTMTEPAEPAPRIYNHGAAVTLFTRFPA